MTDELELLEHTANGVAGATWSAAVIDKDDPRYSSMVRGTNHRFVGTPDYIRVVTSTDDVVDAVGRAVAEGRRVAVRSGGHGFENFTANDEVRVLLDMSEMTAVTFDAARRAFCVQPGATLGHVYRVLFKGWGVTIPAGECPEVGIGGHLVGGGYGPLSRRYGSTVDFLVAVEVVVVDRDGTARVIVATNEPDDPHRELWWAHTGGGGGNFGVVTRYWLRSPGATGTDPRELLPKAPGTWRVGFAMWNWESMTEPAFTRILRNFGGWFERNSGPDSPYTEMTGFCETLGRTAHVMVGAAVDDGVPNAEELVAGYFAEITDGVDVPPMMQAQMTQPWLYGASFPRHGDPGNEQMRRFKLKAAYLRKFYTDEQIATIYRYMSTQDFIPALIMIGYGGKVNTVAPDATAIAQRDSILKAAFLSVWMSEAEDEAVLLRVREFYRDLYASTGGVPVPNEYNDGSYINYPDADLADPEWNTSGVPWTELYYKGNYPRLQRVKQTYDPRNTFTHRLGIQLPD